MRIVEVRDLDGPNLFLLQPAIKVELGDVPKGEEESTQTRLAEVIADLHDRVGKDVPDLVSLQMETPGHIVVAFPWERRAFAESLGKWAGQVVIGERDDLDQIGLELREILQAEPDEDDAPLLIRDADRSIPIISVTGTNGKTTTSRLVAFVLRHLGHKVGLTSSSGVYINKEQVLKGDYSGPSGARRVMADPGVDFAVLETARGGLLLRGCGFEHSDVSVITNVTEDHLGLHGIHTIEGLAKVKAIVSQVVKPGGFCVLNADDPYVLSFRYATSGEPVLFTRQPESEEVRQHIAEGGKAIIADTNGDLTWHDGEKSQVVTNVVNVPMTFDGHATHQVENAMAAMGALLGVGVTPEEIAAGFAAFRSSAEESKGRLNVFEVDGATVIIDFAHNEAGLRHLLNFAHGRKSEQGRVFSVIGTAGDRDDAAFRAIAKCAVENSDVVMLKDSVHYLRGREPGEMLQVMREGVAAADTRGVEILEAKDEVIATQTMIGHLQPGDVLAVMCVEDYDVLLQHVGELGTALV